jgi:hypothetical protein
MWECAIQTRQKMAAILETLAAKAAYLRDCNGADFHLGKEQAVRPWSEVRDCRGGQHLSGAAPTHAQLLLTGYPASLTIER